MSFYLGQESKISLIKVKGFFNKEERLPYVEGGTAVLHGFIYQTASQAMLESAANKCLLPQGEDFFYFFFSTEQTPSLFI